MLQSISGGLCQFFPPPLLTSDLQMGSKELFHLEAFIAKAMLLLKTGATVWVAAPASAASGAGSL